MLRASKQDPERMRRIAEKLLDMAAEGDVSAIKEMGDRLDGRPRQQIDATGAGGGPVRFIIEP